MHDNGGCLHGMYLICALWSYFSCFWLVLGVCVVSTYSLSFVHCTCYVYDVCVSGVWVVYLSSVGCVVCIVILCVRGCAVHVSCMCLVCVCVSSRCGL